MDIVIPFLILFLAGGLFAVAIGASRYCFSTKSVDEYPDHISVKLEWGEEIRIERDEVIGVYKKSFNWVANNPFLIFRGAYYGQAILPKSHYIIIHRRGGFYNRLIVEENLFRSHLDDNNEGIL
ncbi:MAG: hypothetical protein AB3N14_09565 [Flavobacteriaceae bacterium]